MFSMETVQNATLPGWKAVGVFSRRGLGRAPGHRLSSGLLCPPGQQGRCLQRGL